MHCDIRQRQAQFEAGSHCPLKALLCFLVDSGFCVVNDNDNGGNTMVC